MCYGSSAVLLSIIEQLSTETICLAFGIAKEILEKGKSEIIEVNNKFCKDVETAIKDIDFDSVLVVSNNSNLALYKSMNKKIFFVHIHFFYPNVNTDILKLVDVLFVQKFWNLKQSYSAVLVGPLIKPPKYVNNKKGEIIVNLGGGESRFIQPGVNSDYGQQMLNLIIQIRQHYENKEFIICGGTKIIETIKKDAAANHIKALTLSNNDYLKLLDEAEVLISSPGLNAIFEAMYRNIPISFLPPQNVSQVYQLNEYEKAGIAVKGLNINIPDSSMTEKEQTVEFLKVIKQKYSNERIVKKQTLTILMQLDYIKKVEYKLKIKEAISFLGEIGSFKVARIIKEMGA